MEIPQICLEKLNELRAERLEVNESRDRFKSLPVTPEWFYEFAMDNYRDELKRIDGRIRYWESLTSVRSTKKFLDLDYIKENCRIEDYLPGKPVINGKKKWYKCVFHNEKSPSMKVENNKFYCFGCGQHGSVIDIVMHIHKVDFKEALKILGK